MLKSNLLLWQRHWNYCSLPPSLPNFSRWKIIFFSTAFGASMKMFQVEVILEFLRPSYLALVLWKIQKMHLFKYHNWLHSVNWKIWCPSYQLLICFKTPLHWNMSFKSCFLIGKSLTKFLLCYIIDLGI